MMTTHGKTVCLLLLALPFWMTLGWAQIVPVALAVAKQQGGGAESKILDPGCAAGDEAVFA